MKKLVLIMLSVSLVLMMVAACNGAEPPAEEPVTQPESDNGYTEAVAGGPAPLSPEDIEQMWASMFDPETVQLIVNGATLDAAKPFADSDVGAVMLPLVAVAEALGYTVVDNGEEVVITPGTIVTAGVNSYYRGREAARELSSAPVMRDGVMFVPWEFFQEILLTSVVRVNDGNIDVVTIDDPIEIG